MRALARQRSIPEERKPRRYAMAITTDKNTNYGPPLVNQKYAPLMAPVFNVADQPIYTGLLNNRMTMLRAAGLIGQQLELTVPNWPATVAAEAGHLPPLVVVSSNRSAWIRRGINAGASQLLNLGIAAFNNASDLRALTDLNNNLGISPPLYAPSRIGANRNVYIVVNIAEYTIYKSALAGTGIIPVGWNFAKGGGAQRNLTMVGFGATRFAALEFCKTLRRQAAAAAAGVAPWNSAWLIDDNTVALTNFAGFAAVEATLGGNACAGFRGGTLAETPATNKAWARAELLAGRGQQVGALPASLPPGIVQQTALWNINYFDNNHLNFGPLFITSAEDLSITNYFNHAGIGYQFYNGIGVVKEDPSYDNGGGATKVNKGRQDLAKWISAAESVTPPHGAAPPPTNVQPVNVADGGQQTLSQFITNRVLPNAPAVAAQAANANMQAQAKSQGVEQLTSGALNAGFVAAGGIAATFQINGANQQVVQMRNRP
jgi:hypothetical protein